MTLRPRLTTGLPLRCGINNKLSHVKKQEACNLFLWLSFIPISRVLCSCFAISQTLLGLKCVSDYFSFEKDKFVLFISLM